MRAILLVLLLVSAVAGFGIHRFKKRIARGARVKAEERAVQARRLLEGRLMAEAEYVLSRIDVNLERLRGDDGPNSGSAARLQEIRSVLLRTFSVHAAPFPVSGACAEVVETLRETLGDRDLLYSESGDGRWLQACGDRALLGWAIRELFTNTAQHARDWTRIAVLAEPVDGAILLSVRDDGQGLDSSLAARLYSPFTPRAGSEGPGLGLYLVRRIVETVGGTVEARSAPGQGLVHRLRLPQPPSGPYGDAGRPTPRATAHDAGRSD